MPVNVRLVCKFVDFPSCAWWSEGVAVSLWWALPPLEGTISCAAAAEPRRRLPLYTTLPIDFSVNLKDDEVVDHAESSATVILSLHCTPPPASSPGKADSARHTVYRFEVVMAQMPRINTAAAVMDPEHGSRLHLVLIAVDQASHLCPPFTLAPTPRRSGASSARRYKADADKWVAALFAQVMLYGAANHPRLIESCEAFLAARTRFACGQAAHNLVAAMYSAVVNLGSDSKLRSLIARSLYKLAAYLPGYESPAKRPSMRSSPQWSSPGDGERSPATPSSPPSMSPSDRGPRDSAFRSSWTADMWVRMTNHVRRSSSLPRVGSNPDSLRSESLRSLPEPDPASTANSIGRDNCTVSLGDYSVVCPISKGAFGRVFLARERATGQSWALKVLRKHDVMMKNMQHEVFRERDLMELVSHMDVQRQHVVHVKCTFQSQEELFIVQELMPGGDLLSVMMGTAEGCFSEALTRQFTVEIVLALAFLHSMGIIHRDLKPDNILMDAAGHLKLTDFGLSEARRSPLELDIDREPNSAHHGGGGTRGTIDYMAPELILEQPHGYPVDWWSLGVIIVEFLTGCPPFNADTQEEVCQNILTLAVDWDGVPPAAAALCQPLLALDPKVRLGTAGVGAVKAHSYFAGVDWAGAKTAPTLYRPEPILGPEDCVVNFQAREAIFPFRRSDAVRGFRDNPLEHEDVGNHSFGSEFANFSMELTELDMPPLLFHRWTSSPIARHTTTGSCMDSEDGARSPILVPFLEAGP